jgi:hypothetical protein
MSVRIQNLLDPATLRAANVNPISYLATDYLNHFNEVIMLLGLVPDMPDLLEEVKLWQPKSYARHFCDSNFKGRDVAVAAYDAAPRSVRQRFDSVVASADTLLLDTIDRIGRLPPDDPGFKIEVEDAVNALHALVERASGIVNAAEIASEVDEEIDECDPNAAQNAIDALFDAA